MEKKQMAEGYPVYFQTLFVGKTKYRDSSEIFENPSCLGSIFW